MKAAIERRTRVLVRCAVLCCVAACAVLCRYMCCAGARHSAPCMLFSRNLLRSDFMAVASPAFPPLASPRPHPHFRL